MLQLTPVFLTFLGVTFILLLMVRLVLIIALFFFVAFLLCNEFFYVFFIDFIEYESKLFCCNRSKLLQASYFCKKKLWIMQNFVESLTSDAFLLIHWICSTKKIWREYKVLSQNLSKQSNKSKNRNMGTLFLLARLGWRRIEFAKGITKWEKD